MDFKILEKFLMKSSSGHVQNMFTDWTCPEEFKNAISKFALLNSGGS